MTLNKILEILSDLESDFYFSQENLNKRVLLLVWTCIWAKSIVFSCIDSILYSIQSRGCIDSILLNNQLFSKYWEDICNNNICFLYISMQSKAINHLIHANSGAMSWYRGVNKTLSLSSLSYCLYVLAHKHVYVCACQHSVYWGCGERWKYAILSQKQKNYIERVIFFCLICKFLLWPFIKSSLFTFLIWFCLLLFAFTNSPKVIKNKNI